jgi:tRNA(Ser,Leu) C12 N-acetylase TAN1
MWSIQPIINIKRKTKASCPKQVEATMTTRMTNVEGNTDRKRNITAISGSSGEPSSNNHYHRYKQQPHRTNNPRRGGPGILFTCETGREYKARREGLEILQQDWDRSKVPQKSTNTLKSQTDDHSNAPLGATVVVEKDGSIKTSLDEELAQLHKDRYKVSSSLSNLPFSIYETGCKGTVLVLYQNSTVDNDNPEASATKPELGIHGTDSEKKCTSNPNSAVIDDVNSTPAGITLFGKNSAHIRWDPLMAVHRIAQDMTTKLPAYTSSRFITRMIPIQITCYATIGDIAIAVQSLLEPIVAANAQKLVSTISEASSSPNFSFAIQEKRRFCSQLKREPLITAVGDVVGAITKDNPWNVNLSTPDYTIWIEVCKTIAGISIIPAIHMQPRNFNMVEWRLASDTGTNKE